eukprot:1151787-Karenia_brevis.AAC.1
MASPALSRAESHVCGGAIRHHSDPCGRSSLRFDPMGRQRGRGSSSFPAVCSLSRSNHGLLDTSGAWMPASFATRAVVH